MVRQYPFTRTLTTQKVTALVFDKETAEPFNTTVTLAQPINDEKKLERTISKLVSTDTVKFIEIVDIEVEEQLYGITAEDFMAHAVKLDSKTRNPIQ